MKRALYLPTLLSLIGLTMFVAFLFLVPGSAQADYGDDSQVEMSGEQEKMLEIIDILQQLIALLQQQVEAQDGHSHSDVEAEKLSITVEEHEGRAHIHVYEPGEDVVKFFLDDVDVSDSGAIIDAVAVEIDMDEHDVIEAIDFSEVDTSVSEHEHDEDEDQSDDSGDTEMDGSDMDGSDM